MGYGSSGVEAGGQGVEEAVAGGGLSQKAVGKVT